MPRTLSAWVRGWYRDVLLLVARALVSVVMLAHVWQSFGQTGFASTTVAFANFGIPIAIAATAFTLVVELTGSVLLMFGVLTRVAAAGFTFVMAGAIWFVHAKNGIFVKNGGWELVGMIIAVVLGIAANGPGRLSVDQLIRMWRTRAAARKRPAVVVSTVRDTGRHAAPTAAAPARCAPQTGVPAYQGSGDVVTDVRGFPMLSSSFVPLGRPAARPRPEVASAAAVPASATPDASAAAVPADAEELPTPPAPVDGPLWTEPSDQGLFSAR